MLPIAETRAKLHKTNKNMKTKIESNNKKKSVKIINLLKSGSIVQQQQNTQNKYKTSKTVGNKQIGVM